MNIPVQDRSSYLKGLLIVARKDNQLADSEKEMIRGIANRLGFAPDFYEDVLNTLLANKYISEEPIIFSDLKIAESFIEDGLKLAFSDEVINGEEIKWLKGTSAANDISEDWFEEQLKHFKNTKGHLLNSEFALYSII